MDNCAAKTLFIFIDGIGIGDVSMDNNPFNAASSSFFRQGLCLGESKTIPYGGIIKSIDACLGVPGIPQSATGQSTLFSGINTAEFLGYHYPAFPSKKMRSLLFAQNILKTYKQQGKQAVFINAYPNFNRLMGSGYYLKLLEDGAMDSNLDEHYLKHISVTTTMLLSIEQPYFDVAHLKQKQALYHDYTNQSLVKHFPDVPIFTSKEAAEILLDQHQNYDFVLYEYFLTDIVGHTACPGKSIQLIKELEVFISTIAQSISPDKTTLIVTSDHGNIEDCSSGNHTKNPVPFLVWSKNRSAITDSVFSLKDVYHALIKTEI